MHQILRGRKSRATWPSTSFPTKARTLRCSARALPMERWFCTGGSRRVTDPAPTMSAVENILFGATNSVRDYYLQNSNGYYTIEKVAVLGWYDADKPASYYWGPVDTNDSDGDGWVNPHVEKWAEAIRKA